MTKKNYKLTEALGIMLMLLGIAGLNVMEDVEFKETILRVVLIMGGCFIYGFAEALSKLK